MTGGEPAWKLSLPTRAAECFWPLHTFMAVASVWYIETGLECGQWLLTKLKITVTGAKLRHVHSVSQYSLQLLTPFESSFDFPDQRNTFDHRQRPKMFSRANWRQRI
jgi:hypothetical protein